MHGAVTDPPSLDAFRRAGSPIGGLLHDPKTDQRWQVDARTVARDTLAFAPARGMSPRLVAGLVCLAVVVAVMVGVL